jgi:hypothetical protein
VVSSGDTVFEKKPLPVPVTVPPPSLSWIVQLPVAVTVPEMATLAPLQIVAGLLVMLALGPDMTVTVAVPVKLATPAEQTSLSSEEIV